MDARDLFLAQHSAVHSKEVAGNAGSAAERTFGGLTEDQMRVRPREDLNSIAWLMWHIARAEDIIVGGVLANRDQVFEDGWMKRLNITRKDFGIGMKSPEVWDLTRQIDVAALREYRDAVGKRTREIVGAFTDADWTGNVETASLERVAAQGNVPPPLVKIFGGRPRAAVLSGIALFHASGHMGEANTVRGAGGFGTGI
jgi:DinB superfamily